MIAFKGILCLFGLLAVATLPMKGLPETESEGTIEVRMKEGGCSLDSSLSPALGEVRSILLASLDSDEASATTSKLQSALSLAYGDRAVLTSAPVQYEWVFIEGIWVRVCSIGAEFEIDFGSQGTVVVEGRDKMPSP